MTKKAVPSYNFGINQKATGYRVQYRQGEVNHCPGCGNSHWTLRSITAECAFCGTAIPYKNQEATTGAGLIRTRGTSE